MPSYRCDARIRRILPGTFTDSAKHQNMRQNGGEIFIVVRKRGKYRRCRSAAGVVTGHGATSVLRGSVCSVSVRVSGVDQTISSQSTRPDESSSPGVGVGCGDASDTSHQIRLHVIIMCVPGSSCFCWGGGVIGLVDALGLWVADNRRRIKLLMRTDYSNIGSHCAIIWGVK